VTTPDVPALRAANRVAAMWKRLGVRDKAVRAVLNRASRSCDVQPDTARRALDTPLAETTIPAAFRALEGAANSGEPERVDQRGLRQAFRGLAREVIAPASARAAERLSVAGQAGQVTVEAMGSVLTIGLIVLAIWQIVLVGVTYVFGGNAARDGVHELAVGNPDREVRKVVRDEVPGAWRDDMRVQVGKRAVEVRLKVPVLVPGLDAGFEVSHRESTVLEGQP
jgi:pilus assembly protein CpaE